MIVFMDSKTVLLKKDFMSHVKAVLFYIYTYVDQQHLS